ncbi:malate/lactate/ureidoglycolate dehydrogenase [Piscinibacter sp. XHJ-5]|uniref:malate/lactate/ureidoglycolate dehydrogenase n=1 Tax=Piscinibacter sp. XHJ-5 TaxID=3037797 RepID=UPI002452B1B2|nr:malate/lactate/ureidoglycolate dehydrogenase [Piscinibacter sp. XHJ-5]
MAVLHAIPLERLRAAISDLMLGFGSAPREIELVTDNLLQANLTGHDSHGIGMLPRYANAYLEGGLRPNAQLVTRLDSGTLLALDGQAGFGQVIGHDTMHLGIERARRHGSCIVALANSHHLCRIGAWAEMAVAEGLVSVHFVNVISRPIVAPWGGGDARFGTNPFAVGIPVAGRDPIVLDMATSVIAQGKTRVAFNKGEALAPGQLLDDQGRATTDPRYGVVDPLGALRTFGEHKGFGLALVCELLGGALAGGLAVHGPASGEQRVLNGMLTILLDPARLGDSAAFARETRAFLDWVKASRPQEGVDHVRVAGEPERETRAKRLAEGIPVDDNTWQELRAAAVKLGRDPNALDRLAGI